MPVRLNWQVEPDAAVEPAPASGSTVPPAGRPWLRPWFVAGYLLALVTAGWVGFHIGRWTEVGTTNVQAVRNQVEVEMLAWRRGDLGLFQTTLDPTAPQPWRDRVVREFVDAADRQRSLRIAAVERVNADMLWVEVEVVGAAGTRVEERAYRQVKGGWYRTAARGLAAPGG
jgi:hypothetical protein